MKMSESEVKIFEGEVAAKRNEGDEYMKVKGKEKKDEKARSVNYAENERKNKRRTKMMWYDSESASEGEWAGNEYEVSKAKMTGR